MLMIHGLLGGSFCWRMNIQTLAERHLVLAVDLPGFGESDAPRNLDCGMEKQALRLESLLDQLSLEAVDVVGSSWGGAVAIFLASRTNKVRSLALAAPVNPWSRFGAERIGFFAGPFGSTLLRLGMPFSRSLHPVVLQRMYGDSTRIPPGTLEGYSRILMRRGRAHNLVNTLRCWDKDLLALNTAINRVRAPSLLIWGERDGAVDPRSSAMLMQRLPACKCVVLPEVGHLPFEEAPQDFNRLVLEFAGKQPNPGELP